MAERGASSSTISDNQNRIFEDYYRRIFDDLNDGAVIFGFTGSSSFRNGMIIYSNRGFARLVGRPLPRVIGSSIFEFISEEDLQTIRDVLADLTNAESSKREVQIRVKADDGSLAYVNFSIGSVLRRAVTYAIVTDLTGIKSKEEECKRLSGQLLKAQENERKRIASELHDGLAASLSAIKMALENKLDSIASNRPSQVRIEDLITLLKTNITEVRRIMTSLHPSTLDDLGIAATITWHCREYQKTYPHINIELHLSAPEDEIPTSLKTAIFRICQESLNNVAKHSKANLVILSLQKIDKKIELAIKDDGQGFDLSKKPKRKDLEKGFGLDSMRERAEILGGSLSIASSVGSGTTIHAIWPI